MHKKLESKQESVAGGKQPIVLVGMMGCGKTSIGKALAARLGREFIDTDNIIEQKAGCTIAEIFERDGERKFREVEARTIQEMVAAEKNIVIATGGGAVTDPQTLDAIKAYAIGVWIDADLADIEQRVAGNSARPLLNQGDVSKKLNALLEQRKPLYQAMPFHVKNMQNEERKTVDAIVEKLSSATKDLQSIQ